MIFDEIDTGISGITASIVGKKMSELSAHHQILCITHLPQIAAAGGSSVSDFKGRGRQRKLYDDHAAFPVRRESKRSPRLLGGTNVTPTTLASAAELLQSSAYRKD